MPPTTNRDGPPEHQPRTRTLCALVGAAWGVFIGGAVAVYVAALAAGISWVYLFGDDPWPQEASWAIPLVAAAAGFAAFAAAAAAGYLYGKAREGGPHEFIAHKRAWSFAFGPLLMVLILAVAALARL